MSDGHVAMRAGEGGEERWRSRLSHGTAPDAVPGEGDTADTGGEGAQATTQGSWGLRAPWGPARCHHHCVTYCFSPRPGPGAARRGPGGTGAAPPPRLRSPRSLPGESGKRPQVRCRLCQR